MAMVPANTSIPHFAVIPGLTGERFVRHIVSLIGAIPGQAGDDAVW